MPANIPDAHHLNYHSHIEVPPHDSCLVRGDEVWKWIHVALDGQTTVLSIIMYKKRYLMLFVGNRTCIEITFDMAPWILQCDS